MFMLLMNHYATMYVCADVLYRAYVSSEWIFVEGYIHTLVCAFN